MKMPTLENLSDADLLESYCTHDSEAALAVLAARYRVLVFGIAFGYTRDLNSARAVTTRVFLTLARKATSIRGRVSVADWLRHTAADECNSDVQN